MSEPTEMRSRYWQHGVRWKTLKNAVRRKQNTDQEPLCINGVSVDDLSWSANNIATVIKAQNILHFLRVLRRNNLERKLLVAFYWATTEAYRQAAQPQKKTALQRVVYSEQEIAGCLWPSLEDTAIFCLLSRVTNIIKVPTHPGHLFEPLSSGRHYRLYAEHTVTKTSFWFWLCFCRPACCQRPEMSWGKPREAY